ncbi:hypothetical protein [Pontibacter mucosus]|nr:hypothetical protein [Pontibacter mucosus]
MKIFTLIAMKNAYKDQETLAYLIIAAYFAVAGTIAVLVSY